MTEGAKEGQALGDANGWGREISERLHLIRFLLGTRASQDQPNLLGFSLPTPLFFFLFFSWLHLWHMEVPRLGAKLDLHLQPTPQFVVDS